ncbi:diguanylate cyclase (GGDEF)-like protein [Amorphus suaedae]
MLMIDTIVNPFRVLRNRLSLREQMALFTATLCLAAVMLAATWSASVARQVAIESGQHELVQLAETLAERLDQHMFERYREIGNIAGLQVLRPIWTSRPEEARSVLQDLQHTVPDYAWIGLATPDGVVKVATGGLLEGVSVAERPWFIEGLKGITVQDVHDAKLLDSYLRKSPEEEPFRFVDVAVPVLAPDGTLAGVVGAHLSWRWAQDVQASILTRAGVADTTDLRVLSRDGRVLIGPGDQSERTVALIEAVRTQSPVVIENPGDPIITALATTAGQGSYPGLGWVVAAQRPRAVVEAPANALGLKIMIAGIGISIAAGLLAWFLAGTVTKPLAKLSRNVDLVGREPTVTIIGRQNGSRDIVQLSSSIRSLLRRIGTAEARSASAHDEVNDLRREAEARQAAVEQATRILDGDLQTLRKLADTDPLTGLLNRRAFLFAANEAMDYWKRYRRNIGVLLFDIDHFKQVNDTFGHAAGDEVIRRVGEVTLTHMRDTDKVARFGGDEFVVLLREIGELDVEALANRIRAEIAAIRFDTIDPEMSVAVSIGAALAEDTDRDIDDTIQRADKALYEAKAGGRDQVVLAA